MKNKLLLLVFVAVFINACKEDDETPPRATANFDFNTCDAPCTVNFINISQNATSYNWNFGDGTTSTETNPSHLYENAGTYNVKLDATGEGGNHTREKQVVIASPVFHFKYKVNGILIEPPIISAQRGIPSNGNMTIFGNNGIPNYPSFEFVIEEPLGGFVSGSTFIFDSTTFTFQNYALFFDLTSYTSLHPSSQITLTINYINYNNQGVVAGVFSGGLTSYSTGETIQITEGSFKLKFMY